ncbi:hypothetical protein ACFL0L_01615 [Patescibacteria group bacterium]
MNDSISYTITSSEFAKRLEATKYRLVPVFIFIIIGLAAYAFIDSGSSTAISVLVVGLIFIVAGIIKIRFQKPSTTKIDVEINRNGITIKKDKVIQYDWKAFKKVMTSTEYVKSYSPTFFNSFGFERLFYTSAQVSEETHGRVFYLIFKKGSSLYGHQHLIVYAEPDNYQEVENLLHKYLPHPQEATPVNKLKNFLIGLAFVVIAIGLVALIFIIV